MNCFENVITDPGDLVNSSHHVGFAIQLNNICFTNCFSFYWLVNLFFGFFYIIKYGSKGMNSNITFKHILSIVIKFILSSNRYSPQNSDAARKSGVFNYSRVCFTLVYVGSLYRQPYGSVSTCQGPLTVISTPLCAGIVTLSFR